MPAESGNLSKRRQTAEVGSKFPVIITAWQQSEITQTDERDKKSWTYRSAGKKVRKIEKYKIEVGAHRNYNGMGTWKKAGGKIQIKRVELKRKGVWNVRWIFLGSNAA